MISIRTVTPKTTKNQLNHQFDPKLTNNFPKNNSQTIILNFTDPSNTSSTKVTKILPEQFTHNIMKFIAPVNVPPPHRPSKIAIFVIILLPMRTEGSN